MNLIYAGIPKRSKGYGLGPYGLVPSEVRILLSALANFKFSNSLENLMKAGKRLESFFQKEPFTFIWLIFIAAIIALTYFGKHYVKDMIVVSILFLAFLMLEPIVHMAHGSKFTKLISGGRRVPVWKRFPVFFMAILIIFAIKHFLEYGLDRAFPSYAINIVFVFFWLAFLFLLFILIFSKKAKN